ncbi:MAG: ROK family protein [Rhodoferax sp.]|nr:ROK family protein [Rhodoferax sp.]
MQHQVLAIDIGGTLIKTGLVDAAGTVRHARQLPTDAQRGAPDMLARLLDHARATQRSHAIHGVAVSTLGVIDVVSGTVRGACEALPGYLGLSPKVVFENALGLPVMVENDANCVAVAEGWRGAAQGVNDFIALTLGTGIGGGLVFHQRLHRGTHGAAGEWGYMQVEGQRWEDVASLRGLAELAAGAVQATGACPGSPADARQVFERSDAGEPAYQQVVRHWYRVLAGGMAQLIYAFDPQRIVIGGGITGRGALFLSELQEQLAHTLHPDFVGLTEWALAAAGNHAGLLGAARCWFLEHTATQQAASGAR